MSAAEEFYGLTAFKRDCLVAAATVERTGETCYGLAIKRNLEARYGTDVNHGRLYPNLDDLVDSGLLEKSALDKRTNEYVTTGKAQVVLQAAYDELDAVVMNRSSSKRAAADGGRDE
ncbi:helix-turn-helix transcriptional regulator [Halocalculus aciditolerans]|uniref:Transcription regulator PadR N-terminal domain-containing protein n=1 Tax=Halocalculus aciditolerans TaxID=1383812 RepID=A0A830F5Y6_9EURY|nr:helix-turn-helix transcriptional regulator [Halocalculus aciditolerans]GGL57750.1 hypothetical protein GCM10009039_14920 [Halocalculus aciditolerans]